MPPKSPRVFISYSHDHRAHCDLVLAFAQQLRRDGIAAELDQFHQEELLHWPRWCEEQMRPENADFVLCVCTAEYARRVENRTAADVGKGVFWEGKLIYDELYDAKGNPRCVPVLLSGAKDADIPRVLKNYTGFRLDGFGLDDAESGYTRLYRLLTRQASVAEVEVGAVVPLPPGERKMDFTPLQARWSAYYQLRRPPEHFTGRAEVLAELCAALREQAQSRDNIAGSDVIPCCQSVGISAVNGMGGVGKTALALVVGQALRDDFPDMQLFLELRAHSNNPASAGQVRDSVLVAINPQARLPDDEDARWRLYANLFHDAGTGKPLRALVVVDDAQDDEQVRLLSPPQGCALLVTSRQQLQTGRSFHLDRLPRADAMALLQAYAPRLTDEQASRLAELCGDLPVALKTAGGYLKQYRSKPAEEYLAELQQDRLRRLGNKSQPKEDVNLVFDYSYRALDEMEQRAWTGLSIMPASFDRAAGRAVIAAVLKPGWLARLVHPAVPDTNALLDNLVQLNLLGYDEERGRQSWHDLLREYASARLLQQQEKQARLSHAEYFIELAGQTADLYDQGHEYLLQALELFDLERPHLESAFNFLANQPSWAGKLAQLVGCVAATSDLRFSRLQRICWLDAQAIAARRVGSWEHEGAALCNLGLAYADMGEPRKAIEFLDKSLVICQNKGDRHGIGHALNNLGNAYADLGELHKAIKYYEQQLAIAQEINDWSGEGSALGNLGIVYDSLGNPQEAIKFHKQDLSIRQKIGDRRGEGNALGNIGIAYDSLGEINKAIECIEQCLVIDREIGDQRGEGNALWNSALAYEGMGKRSQALSHAGQALAIFEVIEDPNAAQVREALAEWWGRN